MSVLVTDTSISMTIACDNTNNRQSKRQTEVHGGSITQERHAEDGDVCPRRAVDGAAWPKRVLGDDTCGRGAQETMRYG